MSENKIIQTDSSSKIPTIRLFFEHPYANTICVKRVANSGAEWIRLDIYGKQYNLFDLGNTILGSPTDYQQQELEYNFVESVDDSNTFTLLSIHNMENGKQEIRQH